MKTETVLIDQKQLAKKLNISRRTIQRLCARGKFPRPVRIGKLLRWKLHEIEQWIQNDCQQ